MIQILSLRHSNLVMIEVPNKLLLVIYFRKIHRTLLTMSAVDKKPFETNHPFKPDRYTNTRRLLLQGVETPTYVKKYNYVYVAGNL